MIPRSNFIKSVIEDMILFPDILTKDERNKLLQYYSLGTEI